MIVEKPVYSKFKRFYGMASAKALVEENGKDPNHLHIEGIETTVAYTGPVANTINQLTNGLKQALFYTGSHNLEELRDSAFRVVSNSGLIEGSAHGANG
jgi:IMP dehydrogenase